MKQILIGDTHFDIGNGNKEVFEQQIKVFREQIFPYMRANDIKVIKQLGDFTDNRTKISLYIQHRLKEEFFDVLEQEGWELTTLLGNHDIHYRTSREIYSLEVFKKAYNCINLYKEIEYIESEKALYVPWLCNDLDKTKMLESISKFNPEVIYGHFEMKDFYVSKSFKATHGLDRSVFKDIKVFSGHYHNVQDDKNIFYIGTPFQDNWTSYGEKRGFYVLDVNSIETEFIENVSSSKHLKVYLNSESKMIEITDGIHVIESKIGTKTDYSLFKNQKVKIFLDKDNAYNKKVTQKIIDNCLTYKVDIMEELEEETQETSEIKEYNISSAIGECLETPYQKEVYNELLRKSLVDMKE